MAPCHTAQGLRSRICAGHFSPIPKGAYSGDLVNICHSLLSVDTRRRCVGLAAAGPRTGGGSNANCLAAYCLLPTYTALCWPALLSPPCPVHHIDPIPIPPHAHCHPLAPPPSSSTTLRRPSAAAILSSPAASRWLHVLPTSSAQVLPQQLAGREQVQAQAQAQPQRQQPCTSVRPTSVPLPLQGWAGRQQQQQGWAQQQVHQQQQQQQQQQQRPSSVPTPPPLLNTIVVPRDLHALREVLPPPSYSRPTPGIPPPPPLLHPANPRSKPPAAPPLQRQHASPLPPLPLRPAAAAGRGAAGKGAPAAAPAVTAAAAPAAAAAAAAAASAAAAAAAAAAGKRPPAPRPPALNHPQLLLRPQQRFLLAGGGRNGVGSRCCKPPFPPSSRGSPAGRGWVINSSLHLPS